jgi:nitrite reductase/ring-hydroxylating ferredoxin subunit
MHCDGTVPGISRGYRSTASVASRNTAVVIAPARYSETPAPELASFGDISPAYPAIGAIYIARRARQYGIGFHTIHASHSRLALAPRDSCGDYMTQRSTTPSKTKMPGYQPMTILCSVDDLVDGADAKGFTTDHDTLLALKRDGQIFVYRNSCPHLGVELNWLEDQFLDSDGMFIQCATHGALFTVETGACVAGPCLGKSLESIPFSIIDGRVEI